MALDAQTHEEDITRVEVDGKEVILVGTAHISQQSVDVVRDIIERERPDTVCVELDEERFKALREQARWEELDLKQIIRNKQLMFLMARLALMSFQKQMGSYTGVKPGAEMAAAIDIAEEQDAHLILCDRNVRTTLLRAWRNTPWYKRAMLATSLLFGVFEKTEVNEEELAKLREQQNISGMLDELGEAMPEVKSVMVDERDTFMADQIRRAPGEKVVVVIGAAHKPGILKKVNEHFSDAQIEAIDTVPASSPLTKFIPWIIPLIVIGLFVFGFTRGDIEDVKQAALAWFLANGIFASLGAAIALAHPVTIVIAFFAAPLTSLNPTIHAGMVAALAQVWATPPRVKDMEQAGDDIAEYRGWWSNRFTRVLLVFVFTALGSMIGTFAALPFFRSLLS